VPPDYLFTDRHASGGEGNMTLRLAMKLFAGVEESKPLDKQAWEKLRDGLREFMESEWNNSNIMAIRAGGEGDVTKSNRIWQQTRGIPEISSALIYDKRIYQVRNGGLVVCRHQETGELIYEERLAAQGGYFASPVAADGRIYMVSDQGVVTVVRPGDSFSELARNEIGESVKATPALAKGTIIIRSASHLWAFGEHAQK
jgi:outer membrane protein assembly factor BamB